MTIEPSQSPHVRPMRMLLRLAWLAALSLFSLSTAGAEVSAHVSRSEVGPGESFRLVVEAQGSVEGYPDLTPLNRDFHIVARSQNSSVRVVNGKVHRRTALVLTLMPAHGGTLQIPALSLGREHTQPIEIKVSDTAPPTPPAHTGDDTVIEAMVMPQNPRAGQQIMLHVRVLSADRWVDGSFSIPSVSPSSTPIEPVGKQHYVTTHRGQRYAVIEQVYALYPRMKGRIDIGSVTFTSTPYYDAYGTQHADSNTLRSSPLEVEVQPAAPAPAISYPPPLAATYAPRYDRAYGPPLSIPPSGTRMTNGASQADESTLPAWVIILLASGWIAALAIWAWNRKGMSFRLPLPRRPELKIMASTGKRSAIKQVEQAYASKRAEEARRALLNWAAVVWPDNPPTNLTRTAERCPTALADAIRVLEESFYGPVSTPWFDVPIARMLGDFDSKSDKKGPTPYRAGLQPLNPSYSNSP